MGRFHVFGNWLVGKLINVIFGADLGDIMSGYRAFTREAAMNLPIMAYGFDIETEMTIQCLYRRWVVREVPIAYRERPEGSVSKLSTFRDGMRVIFRILSLFRSYKPLTFFGGMGIFFFLMSCGMAAAVRLGDWLPESAYRLSLIIGAATLMAMRSMSLTTTATTARGGSLLRPVRSSPRRRSRARGMSSRRCLRRSRPTTM